MIKAGYMAFCSLFKPHQSFSIIVIGIDYQSHKLLQLIIAMNRSNTIKLNPIALIDDEPWHNRTELYGVKVHSESDLVSLVINKNVKAVICLEGERMRISSLTEKILMNKGHKTLCQLIYISKENVLEFEDSLKNMCDFFKERLNNL